MIHGGTSDRTCKKCKQNNIQKEYNCGYLFNDDTCDKSITFEYPALNDTEFFTFICPIFYFNEYNHLYSTINLYRESKNIDFTKIEFGIRTAIRDADNYIEQLKSK